MNVALYSEGVKFDNFNFRDEFHRQMVDFQIRCSDGRLSAHIIILSARCPYFRNFVVNHPAMRTIDLAQNELVDVNCDMMMKFLRLIYGEVVRLPEEEITEFNRVCKRMKLDHWVKFDHMLIAGEINSPMESSDSAPDISSAATTISEELSRRSGEGESSGR